eukprot:2272481-Lingulodinium_polyedra.AAC.1
MRLRGRHLVSPTPAAGAAYAAWGLLLHDASEGRAGKTGTWDAAVLVDLDQWIWPFLGRLKAARRDDELLW